MLMIARRFRSLVRSGVRSGIGIVTGVALAGCGLISSDVTNFDLTLPDKKFTVDAGGWHVDQMAADRVLAMSCDMAPDACNTAVKMACPTDCSGVCNAARTCDLLLDISLSQSINLVMEKPELQSISSEPLIKVTIDSVTYAVTGNSLNVDTPELTIYVAPTTVVTPKDALATPIGTIASVPAMHTTTTPEPLVFTSTGRAQLVSIMSSFKTPFNVLLGASIIVTAGEPVPTGKLDAVVYIKGHAGL
jgi:hypothetical protein